MPAQNRIQVRLSEAPHVADDAGELVALHFALACPLKQSAAVNLEVLRGLVSGEPRAFRFLDASTHPK